MNKNINKLPNQLINQFTINPKKLFLIDGLGAFLTAFFLGAILATFEAHFGMPRKVAYGLSFVACMYGVYSMCCYFFVKNNWRTYLSVIAIANLMYACLTVGLVVYFYEKLSHLGLVYFSLELFVMISLIIIELIVILRKPKSQS